MSRALFFAILIALGLPSLAIAQDAPATPAAAAAPTLAQDKSGFTLFNPTPVADLRALCTDRPSKSASPCTVDAGHVQIESDVANVTVDRSGGLSTTTYLVTNPTVKLGLTNTLDVEFSLAPWEVITVRDRATGARTRQSGVGDFFAKVKWNLLGDDGGPVGLAVAPYVKLPTAELGIGNGAVEGGAVALISVNLSKNWSLNVNPEIDILKNAADDSRHANTSVAVSLNRPVTKTVTLTGEIWTDINFDPAGTVTQVSADFGAAWIPAAHPNFQLDGGVNFGLDRQTPAAQVYVGVSRRF